MRILLRLELLAVFMILSPALADSKVKPGRNIASSESEQKILAWLTVYCPKDSKNITMEGGSKDQIGKDIQTLQEYLDGTHEFVTFATSKKACPYGNYFYSPELDTLFKSDLNKLSQDAYRFKINSIVNILESISNQKNKYAIPHIILSCRDTGSAFTGEEITHIDLAISADDCSNLEASGEHTKKLVKEFKQNDKFHKYKINLYPMFFGASPLKPDLRIDPYSSSPD